MDIEEELGQQLQAEDRLPVRTGVRRRRNFALKSPAAIFFEKYTAAETDNARAALYDNWRVRYLRRGDTEATAEKLRRRFKQYLSLGKKSPAREARIGGRQIYSIRNGAISRIQTLLGKAPDEQLPQYLWVTVYVTKLRPISEAAIQFQNQNDKARLMTPMVYVGHRRDSQLVRDRVRISNARARPGTNNGLIELTALYLQNGFVFRTDFDFEEIWDIQVLGEVDHGHGLEASNALQASLLEDLKRIEIIEEFLEGDGPRPLNAKIDNSLLGVTNIEGLLGPHDRPVEDLNVERIMSKLNKAKRKLQRSYENYKKRFIKDENGVPALPAPNVTRDGIGQVRTAQFSQQRRRNILRQMAA